MARWLLACVLALFAFAGPGAAQAPQQAPVQRFALVVGVSGYGGGIPHLQGPKNDASLITTLLLEQGVPRANIRLLADQMDTAVRPIAANGSPTRAAILAGYRWLAERGGPNAEIMIFMAGHGTQIPAGAASNEFDRMTEVFLPIDAIAAATQQPAGVSFSQARNFLSDDDIGDALEPILATGARVWFVVDSCHSGTLSRSAGSDSVAREVPAAALNIPAAAPATLARSQQARVTAARQTRFDRFQNRRFTAFYAAQPYQRAYESSQPRSAPGQTQRKYGEMTWNLVQALRAGESGSYTTVAQRVLAGLWQMSGDRTTPMFEGAMNDRPMYGAGAQRVVPLTVQGGRLFLASGWAEDVTDGSVYAIVDSSNPTRVLGEAIVDQLGAAEARFSVRDGADPLVASAMSTSVSRVSARLRQRSVPFVMSVARPQMLPYANSTQADQELLARAAGALQSLAHRPAAQQPIAFELALPGQPADLYPYVADNRLWFFPAGAALYISRPGAAPYRLEAERANERDIGAALRVIGRARNLLRVAATVSESETSRALRTRVFVQRNTSVAANQRCDQQAWRILRAVPAGAAPVSFESEAPIIRHCDTVYIEMRNAGPVTLAVAPFYMDPWSQMSLLIPQNSVDGRYSLRLPPGQTRVIAYPEDLAPYVGADVERGFEVPVKAEGLMHILMLTVPWPPTQSAEPSFEYLLWEHPQPVTRSAGAASFETLLQDAGLARESATLRSAGSNGNVERGGAAVISLFTTTLPPS